MSALDLAKRFVVALEGSDVDAVRAFYHADAGIWHNFDRKTQSVDENMAVLGWMLSAFPERKYQVTRLEAIEGGYLQQHTLELRTADGKSASTDALVIVTVRDDRIAKLEEYIDAAPILALAGQ